MKSKYEHLFTLPRAPDLSTQSIPNCSCKVSHITILISRRRKRNPQETFCLSSARRIVDYFLATFRPPLYLAVPKMTAGISRTCKLLALVLSWAALLFLSGLWKVFKLLKKRGMHEDKLVSVQT